MAGLALGSLLMGCGVGMLVISGADYYWQGLGWIEADFRDKLRRLRISTRNLRKWLVAWSILVALALLVFWIGFDAIVFGIVSAGLLIAIPWYIIKRLAETRRMKIEDQLADAMVALSSAIKAGLSLGQSLKILADQCPRPICQEFRQIVGEFQLGKPLEQSLTEARDRLKSENFALFSAAMLASRESGGRLNETVERIAHSVMEMQRVERRVISETAQARTSALYMALAPLAVLLVYYLVIDRVNTERLFTTLPGQLILCTSLLFNILAYLWARAILNPDI
ncbi:MAG TPA: type II secretion system F family protein [Planctomycetaceae bacterium]|nr:type II secretion system F family protein [Planctomycetaceae bacterium]